MQRASPEAKQSKWNAKGNEPQQAGQRQAVQEAHGDGEDEMQRVEMLKVNVDPQWKYIVNVGSVGQPRDRNPMAACSIYDTDTHVVEVKRVSYDIQTAQEKILKVGLPASLAERLAVGR